MVLCCECGVEIASNPSNMCPTCLPTNVDITANIPKQAVLHFCRNCERYLQPPGEWISATLGSRELIALCLKRLKGIKKLELIHAGFIWTEPHSRRIKMKLTVRGEYSDTILQKVFIVEFTVQNQMCEDCHLTEAKDYWQCLVQVRQHAANKKTFYYLEQFILKHKAHENTLGIKPMHGGLNFYYAHYNHARRMIDFLQAMMPVKVTMSRRLITHDVHSNNFHYRYTWSVEIVPISKDSVVCLSKKLRQQLGNLSPLCLIHKVTNGIHLIDPLSAQISELSGQSYFRTPFESICDPKHLFEYIVMDIETIHDKDRRLHPGQGQISFRHQICDIWVVRASELGINENTVHTRSHLGHLLNVGDSVMGYNMRQANINDAEFEKLSADLIPDVLLVRKCYSDIQNRRKNRLWKLKHLADEATDERIKYGYHEFLDDLEEDADYRKQVNIYRDVQKIPINDRDNFPRINLEEMLDELTLDSADDSKS